MNEDTPPEGEQEAPAAPGAAPWWRDRRLLTPIKLLFSGGVLAYFLSTVDTGRLGELVMQVSAPMLALVVFLSIFRTFVGAWRFEMLLRPVKAAPLGTLTRHYFIGTTFNQILPSALGGDAVRILLLREVDVKKTEAAVFILVERMLGLLSLAILGAVVAPFADLPTEPAAMVYGVAVCAVVGFAALSFIALKVPAEKLRFSVLRRASEALKTLAAHPRALAAGFFGSAAFQLVGLLTSWVIALAFSLDIPVTAFLTLVPLVYLATVVPISMGGVGLREIAFVYLFGFIGVGKEASLAISLGTYATLVLPGVIGAALYLRSSLRKERASSQAS
jgi:uncharacterized protein (TIRG00374 family)